MLFPLSNCQVPTGIGQDHEDENQFSFYSQVTSYVIKIENQSSFYSQVTCYKNNKMINTGVISNPRPVADDQSRLISK